MKTFEDAKNMMRYLAETRIACSGKWDPSGNGNFEWYAYPDWNDDEDMLVQQGPVWSDPVPLEASLPFPAKLGFGELGNIIFFDNISLSDEHPAPVAVFDAFDDDGKPCSFAMFGQGDTSLRNKDERVKLIVWSFEGLDDEDELAWEHSICC